MATSYIPTKDSELDLWAANFSTRITATPLTYGLTAGIATAIAALYATWHTAFLLATNPVTRTEVTVAAKDSAKGAMVPQLRLYSQQVKANVAVSDANKTDLGIHLDDTIPTPIPPPSTIPIVTIVGNGPGTMELRFADSATPTKRTKPPGATGLLMFRNIGVAAITDPELARFDGLFGRIPVNQTFEAGDVGNVCTYFARWCNAKGEEGPWSNPTSRVIT